MTEAADADDPDSMGRVDLESSSGTNGDSAAEERRGRGARQLIGQSEREATVDANPIGEPAEVTEAGGLLRRAEVFVSEAAHLAVEARSALPTDADALPARDSTLGAGVGDDPDDLVTGHERKDAAIPGVVD